MTVRKKWRLTYSSTADTDEFRSKVATYEHVQALARSLKAGAIDGDTVTVWVDEGRGWERFEALDLAELAAMP